MKYYFHKRNNMWNSRKGSYLIVNNPAVKHHIHASVSEALICFSKLVLLAQTRMSTASAVDIYGPLHLGSHSEVKASLWTASYAGYSWRLLVSCLQWQADTRLSVIYTTHTVSAKSYKMKIWSQLILTYFKISITKALESYGFSKTLQDNDTMLYNWYITS